MKNIIQIYFEKMGLFCFLLFFFTWCWLAMGNLSCWFRCKRGSVVYSIFCWCGPRFIVSFRRCISMVNLKIRNDLHCSFQLRDLKLFICRSSLALFFKQKILQMLYINNSKRKQTNKKISLRAMVIQVVHFCRVHFKKKQSMYYT